MTGRLLKLDKILSDAKRDWGLDMIDSAYIPDHNSRFLIPVGEERIAFDARYATFLKYLSHDDTFEVARFLYHLWTHQIDSPAKMEALLRGHNTMIKEWIDRAKDEPAIAVKTGRKTVRKRIDNLRTGLSHERIKEAIVTEKEIDKSNQLLRSRGTTAIDQLTVAKLLVRSLGQSSAYAILSTLRDSELIMTAKDGKSVVIVSPGKASVIFERYLKNIENRFRSCIE